MNIISEKNEVQSNFLQVVPNIKKEILSYLNLNDLKSVRLSCQELNKRVSQVPAWKRHEMRKKVIAHIPLLKNAQDKIKRSLKISRKVVNIGAAISSAGVYYGLGSMIYSAYFLSKLNTTALLIVAGISTVFTSIILRQSQLEKDLQLCSSLLNEANSCKSNINYSVSEEIFQKIELILSKYK